MKIIRSRVTSTDSMDLRKLGFSGAPTKKLEWAPWSRMPRDGVKRLKKERKALRAILKRLEPFTLRMTLEPNNNIRNAITAMLLICASPEREYINRDLLLTVWLLNNSQARAAATMLKEVIADYGKWISHAKDTGRVF